ncbi:hypothetical protein MRX96_053106, partial [Rhipicephalus microplus]
MRKLPTTSINIAPRLTGAFLGLRGFDGTQDEPDDASGSENDRAD